MAISHRHSNTHAVKIDHNHCLVITVTIKNALLAANPETMKRYHPLAFALLFNLAFAAAPGDEQALVAQARQITHDLNAKLKQTLKEVLDKEGTVQAVETCHIKAPDIVADAGRNGWEVRRTSLKVRNLEDAPDKWESSVLEIFEARNEKGEPVSKLEAWAVTTKDGRKVFRYMKAIPVRKVCLRCHGDKVDRHVAKQLDSLYPFDQARGYTGGEIRGAFSVKNGTVTKSSWLF